ncbi:MAG: CbiX/SirB N-terminal domain-containing protein [Candidatus Omnitrophica bacterium]|jgi:sirohydrochlorin cobaltochelatase|nr:CbiX/SirB N-terminal domain-containing protein [Candidatus Omnitrophota bacterium]
MKTILVLAMHGMTPKDYPLEEKREFLKLHSQADSGGLTAEQRVRHDALDLKMRKWQRTPQNDPYHTAATEIAAEMQRSSGNEVILGYNEFCWPSLQEAFSMAAQKNASRVVIVTAMMTRGGNHAEEEIPAEIEEARKKFPNIQFEYAWPFSASLIANFLTEHVGQTAPAK